MNKIKEEILSRNWMTKNNVYEASDMILNVMDKYAKEVAIDFLEWGTSRNIKISPGIVVDDDSMCGSIEEYYDLYLKSKSNEQKH